MTSSMLLNLTICWKQIKIIILKVFCNPFEWLLMQMVFKDSVENFCFFIYIVLNRTLVEILHLHYYFNLYVCLSIWRRHLILSHFKYLHFDQDNVTNSAFLVTFRPFGSIKSGNADLQNLGYQVRQSWVRGHPHMTSDFFKGFLTYLPTHVWFCPNKRVLFYLVVSDFCKPTYLPKNRTSYVDGPLRIL